MKRHEAIAPLSRDHHDTLILAQLLKKNAPAYRDMPTGAKDKAAYAQQRFNEHIKKHFDQEEKMLDKTKGINKEIDVLTEEIRAEHNDLKALFTLLGAATDLEKAMDVLAIALQEHIRKEERVLFPLLQQHCTEDKLHEIHELLH